MDPVSKAGGEATRRFAGRLAHEINNVLMALQGYAELMQMSRGGEPSDEMAGIRRACDRLGLLTRRLLQFGGRWALRPRDVAAAELVNALAERVTKRCATYPGLALTLGSLDGLGGDGLGEARLVADPGALEACVDALVDNAAEAQHGAGKIAFAARVDGKTLAIEVSDAGPGMEPEVLEQACEPMFTTHRERKAEGLGLSVVVGLVAMHKGDVTLRSPAEGGLCATICLPLAPTVASRT